MKYVSWFIRLLILVTLPLLILKGYQYLSKAAPIKANIKINTRRIVGVIPFNWKALAQGGEEQGVRMFENVISQVADLSPQYIRIDHIYDFYNVVNRNSSGQLGFNWSQLDQTICDIYNTGAKPFFVFGYMPSVLSADGSLISKPKDWGEWTLLIKNTIERYSGKSTQICNRVGGNYSTDIYYEVWNEPDLNQFGKWDINGGDKSYNQLYFYSTVGAQQAQNVNYFYLGGPTTASLSKDWVQKFLTFVDQNNLRLDFISWHHYSTKPNDYMEDLVNLSSYLQDAELDRFKTIPKIISEWGYSSDVNPIADTEVGATHTVASVRNLIEQQLNYAFAFDIKDGPAPRWGILTHSGEKKPRYLALKLLNFLDRNQLQLEGEGTFVQAIASIGNSRRITVILVNYDENNSHSEMVPVAFNNLNNGSYKFTQTSLGTESFSINMTISDNQLRRTVIMAPNSVVALELEPV